MSNFFFTHRTSCDLTRNRWMLFQLPRSRPFHRFIRNFSRKQQNCLSVMARNLPIYTILSTRKKNYISRKYIFMYIYVFLLAGRQRDNIVIFSPFQRDSYLTLYKAHGMSIQGAACRNVTLRCIARDKQSSRREKMWIQERCAKRPTVQFLYFFVLDVKTTSTSAALVVSCLSILRSTAQRDCAKYMSVCMCMCVCVCMYCVVLECSSDLDCVEPREPVELYAVSCFSSRTKFEIFFFIIFH